ncbi:uncharacterized protein STEHIDRAFT_156675 [Stereum hirsutum FP-91666 SS1]|uniref:uncharacterized protein n=1 Tax=Stereum hirsutum (strain FP-91666) TaxID=721885 RepID=UPI000440F0A8|nr:uncharacterized protein STEHIDRAFT_156675 [Stereum hirsutum FP-91666 SS1]EIM86346.1 hypothetical protein STEHIDRAFT_156675 [Stereum hirsutum FP-91666 SS1]
MPLFLDTAALAKAVAAGITNYIALSSSSAAAFGTWSICPFAAALSRGIYNPSRRTFSASVMNRLAEFISATNAQIQDDILEDTYMTSETTARTIPGRFEPFITTGTHSDVLLPSSGLLPTDLLSLTHYTCVVRPHPPFSELSSLPEQCEAICSRLLTIEGFSEYFRRSASLHAFRHPIDIVTELRDCLALGAPLCYLFNWLPPPYQPIKLDVVDPNPFLFDFRDKVSRTRAIKTFIAYCQGQSVCDGFDIHDLTDKSRFAKVLASVNAVLDALQDRVFTEVAPPSEAPLQWITNSPPSLIFDGILFLIRVPLHRYPYITKEKILEACRAKGTDEWSSLRWLPNLIKMFRGAPDFVPWLSALAPGTDQGYVKAAMIAIGFLLPFIHKDSKALRDGIVRVYRADTYKHPDENSAVATLSLGYSEGGGAMEALPSAYLHRLPY